MKPLILVSSLLVTLVLLGSAVPAWADTKGVRVDGKAPADYIAAQGNSLDLFPFQAANDNHPFSTVLGFSLWQ